jgi:hypothetical protein
MAAVAARLPNNPDVHLVIKSDEVPVDAAGRDQNLVQVDRLAISFDQNR